MVMLGALVGSPTPHTTSTAKQTRSNRYQERESDMPKYHESIMLAGAARATWIAVIRTRRDVSPREASQVYFKAKDAAIEYLCRTNNESLAEKSDEELAELEMTREEWNPKELTDYQRERIDRIIADAAVEFLAEHFGKRLADDFLKGLAR